MRAFTNFAVRLALIAASASIVPQTVLHAQDLGTRAIADIPFAFQVGAYHYAAGKYTLLVNQDHILTIQGTTNSGLMQVSWDSARHPSTTSELVFHHYGNHYFLHELRVKGSQDFLKADGGMSKEEKQAQKEELALNHGRTSGADSTTEVALLDTSR
jgi:hypothetical protein